MENRIVAEPISKIKEIARNAAKGNWWKLFIGVFIYIAVSFAITLMTGMLAEAVPMYRYLYAGYEYYAINFTGVLLWIVDLLLIAPLVMGLNIFFIGAFRTKSASYVDLFKGFTLFPKAVGLCVLLYVKIIAWGLPVLIPGVIIAFVTYEPLVLIIFAVAAAVLEVMAALRYSQAMLLLADNRETGVFQCIRESKRLMKGNKGKFFCLQLSFIGWILLWIVFILAIFALFAVAYAVSIQFFVLRAYSIIFTASIIIIISMVISMIPLATYIGMSAVSFYELLTGNLVVVAQTALDRPETYFEDNLK